MTLNIGSWSPKSKSTLYCVTMIQYIYFGLTPSFGSRDGVQKQNFGLNWTFQSAVVTLKIRSRSPKNLINPLPTMYLFKFGQNQQTGSGDRVRKRLCFTVFILYRLVTLTIRSRLPNLINSFPPPNNVSMQVC